MVKTVLSSTSRTHAADEREVDRKPRKKSKSDMIPSGFSKPAPGEKYKYVRFVEKKKVLRKMRQLQQSIMQDSVEGKEEMRTRLDELRSDLLYIDKFPSNQKYISLFPCEGQLSPEGLSKQKEIRAMIINLTRRSDERSDRRTLDVVKGDDFFASVDNIEKPMSVVADAKKKGTPATDHARNMPSRRNDVHPSWKAKKQNEKLTGSIAATKFEGNRVTFDEDD
jgi:hypothetical protein